MAIIVLSTPESYGLAYNDNPYVFYSTAYAASQRFKVLILPSTYPTDPILSTVRVYPRQGVTDAGVVTNDRTYFDPSRILQTQLAGNIAIPSANHQAWFSCPSMHYEYALFIQEENKVGGQYVKGASIITDLKSVWNGVRNKVDWLDFDYTDYLLEGETKKFLTDAPRTQYINSNQSLFLYMLADESTDVSTYTIKAYNSTGSLFSTAKVTNSNSALADTDYDYRYLRIPVGTYDIANVDPSLSSFAGINTMLDNAAYYIIQITDGANARSEKVTIHINAKCSKYTPVRLHWLNRLGGFDSFNFNLKSEEETAITRASYLQDEHRFTGTSWVYDSYSRGTTDYHVKTQDKITVNTDYLTEAESVWMNDFASSPVVFQEVNNQLIAMSGKPKMIDRQTSLNNKLMQYTFELDYSLNNNRQRG
jgi:hypothetical protein